MRELSEPWTARQALIDICRDDRDSNVTAIARRRELRRLNIDPAEHDRRRLADIDTNISLAVAAGHGTHRTPPTDLHTDEVSRKRPTRSTLAGPVRAPETETTEPALEPLEAPGNDINAHLRAELASLPAPAINRPDDGFGLELSTANDAISARSRSLLPLQ